MTAIPSLGFALKKPSAKQTNYIAAFYSGVISSFIITEINVKSKGIFALLLGALIATVTAVAHMSCIILGPSCFEAQLAPPHIVRSAMEGTSTATIETTIVSSLFLACALFAISGAGLIRKLPFLKSALITISIICLVRGLATIPLSFYEPVLRSTYGLISGFIWFLAGCLYLYGFLWVRKAHL